jgi:hypothetical protein
MIECRDTPAAGEGCLHGVELCQANAWEAWNDA